ncbi:Sapep family Mn(2+)-dependent dipeptidase [Guggenheimella bovis]
MEQLLKDIKRLVNIPSVCVEQGGEKPLGDGIDQALNEALEMFKSYGFETYKDPQGYYGYAEMGTGELFGILGHLDVVPAGNVSEWTHAPFEFYQDEENIYGRGVSDDKGPIVIALHALLDVLKDKKLNKRVRFILGTDEETDWRGINKYKADGMEIPAYGIVPDSDFPVVYVEKTILQVDLKGKGSDLSLKSGVAYNVVCGEARYQKDEEVKKKLEEMGSTVTEENGELVVKGKNAHAAVSFEGKNALIELLSALHQSGKESPAAKYVHDKLLNAPRGEKLLKVTSDKESGSMTVNLGLVELGPEEEVLKIDMRLPVTFDVEKVIEEMNEDGKAYGLHAEVKSKLDSLYLPKESDFVQTLVQSFRDVTGDMTEPVISGGGTYARAMKNFISFGPSLPGKNYHIHEPNERVPLKDIEVTYEVYKEAFKRLLVE